MFMGKFFVTKFFCVVIRCNSHKVISLCLKLCDNFCVDSHVIHVWLLCDSCHMFLFSVEQILGSSSDFVENFLFLLFWSLIPKRRGAEIGREASS